MSAVFADTVYYFAFLNPKDEWHEQARAFTQGFNGRMVTEQAGFSALLK